MKKLQEIANELQGEKFEKKGSIYHPIPFPEFDKVTTSSDRAAAYAKWDKILRALSPAVNLHDARVLDIGANIGFYSFNFAKLGAQVEAYEPHEHYVRYGLQITEATGLPIAWHNKNIDYSDIKGPYDVALMLSVFQWISGGNERLAEATELLKKIAASSRYLVFELGCNHGKSAINVQEGQLQWLYKFLKETTAPKQVKWLGTVKAWGKAKRDIFICSQEAANLTAMQKIVTKYLELRYFPETS